MSDDDKSTEEFNFTSFNYDILCGRFLMNHVPDLRAKLIRIYLCAPFSDMFDETCHLFTHVFPKLREFSMARYGMEFQVVNLNWDVDVQNKQNLVEDSLKEIKKCKANSIGMTFMNLIGSEYGPCFLPSWIDRELFSKVIKCLKENRTDPSNLENQYNLNINYLTNRFELQTDKQMSVEAEEKAIDLLKKGAQLAIEKKLIDSSFLNELNQSILQKLMTNAAFSNEPKENRMFSFIRLHNVAATTGFPNKKNTMNYLRDREINYYFPVEQIYRIGIEKLSEEYLRNFGLHYEKLFKGLIEQFVKLNAEDTVLTRLYRDVLYQLNYVKFLKLNEIPQSAQNVFKKLSDYVLLDNNHSQPFILTGDMGSGKSTLIATFFSSLFLQLSTSDEYAVNKHTILIRFVGIDGESTYLRTLLKSICFQLQYVKNNNCLGKNKSIEDAIPKKLSELKRFFKKFLTENFFLDQEMTKFPAQKKLIIILDQLQDLCRSDSSYKLDWLPKNLNPYCKLILTVSSESKELVQRLNRKFTNPSNYAHVGQLETDQVEYLIRKLLNANNYRLEPGQYQKLNDLVRKKPILPLHVKLLSENFLNWKSYTCPEDECVLGDTLHVAINYFLNKLEKDHGYLFVKHALCYLTISVSGLSECELQDMLSLDNELLKNFKSRDLIKLTANALKMPWFYVIRLLNGLENYLLRRPFHGVYTLSWRHQFFGEIIRRRYLDGSREFSVYLHKVICEFYLGKWSGGRSKPLTYEKVLCKGYDPNKPNELVFDRPIIKKIKITADRLVPAQPNVYEDFHAYIRPRYNLRKLKQLPYHLIQANMLREAFEHVFFNIDWIYAKINAFDLQTTIYDFDMFEKEHFEVALVRECLKLSVPAIEEDVKLLFNEISGRLLPFYHSYDNIGRLLDQCDRKIAELNQLLPIGQIFNSPAWINSETLDVGISLTDHLQIDLLESKFNGRILVSKSPNATVTQFFDLDLLESMSDIYTGKGVVYCSRNGDFVCTIENNSKLLIREIQNGELYGAVDFDEYELGHVYLSAGFASIILRKTPSPLLIDLKACKLLKIFPYQTCFSFISADDKVLLIHSEKSVNYFHLPSLERAVCLECVEIPEMAVFAGSHNSKLFLLTKDTKEVIYYNILVEKKYYTTANLIQDKRIVELKVSPDESFLLVCSLDCIYVFDLTENISSVSLKFKLEISKIESYLSLTKLNGDTCENELADGRNGSRNLYTGFGCTSNNRSIFCTYYTHLVCFDAATGELTRLIQSTLAANRIVKSFASNISDAFVSLLDNNRILVWNLGCIDLKESKFENMSTFTSSVSDCLVPRVSQADPLNSNFLITYSSAYPDAKIHDLRGNCTARAILASSAVSESSDNLLTSSIRRIVMDACGRYCFMVNDVVDFAGKRSSVEQHFVKRICTLVDLVGYHVIEKMSFIVKRDSRFDVNAQFFTCESETYLLVKLVSCISDFDPYNSSAPLDWTEYETNMRLYGPLTPATSMPLYDEFKLEGEMLSEYYVTREFTFVCLMQECQKLFDKEQPSVVKAKRYDVSLNTYELFEAKLKALKVQKFSLNEFLGLEDYGAGKNVFLDVRVTHNNLLLVVYSKEGAVNEREKTFVSGVKNVSATTYEYDYERFKFKRDIRTEKAAVIYDARLNQVVRKFSRIFDINTNIDELILSDRNGYACDSLFNLYEVVESGQLIRNIERDNSYNSNLRLSIYKAQFLLEGRYLLASGVNRDKLYVVRCYDSFEVASLKLKSRLTCLRVGEEDRTIVIGTEDGNVLALKLLVDLEKQEAIDKYIRFYRSPILMRNVIEQPVVPALKQQQPQPPTAGNRPATTNALNNDLKRVIHSASAHRQLRYREWKAFSNPIASLIDINNNSSAASVADLDGEFHSGVAKLNLTNVTLGIRHTSMGTRACVIQ